MSSELAADLVVRGRRVVTPQGERPASVVVRAGRIVGVAAFGATVAAVDEMVLDDAHVLLPGLVDTHVHLQDPGRDWEGFDSGTRAAAAGGVTTLVDMPLDCVPATVDVPSLDLKRDAARGRVHVDLGFWGGVTPDNLGRLGELTAAGVLGFKCFLVDPGLPDFAPLGDADLVAALAELAAVGERAGQVPPVLLVHAEDAAALAQAPPGPQTSYASFLAGHPATVEVDAVARVIAATRATGGRSHIVHVSAVETADLVADARADGVLVSAETCPHYLCLSAEEVPPGRTEFVVAPPLREAANASGLWQRLAGGRLSMVVSDHSPCGAELKHRHTGDFAAAFGGIASLQLSLPVVWSAASARGHTLADLVRWMSAEPARLAGLTAKGAIAPGKDADLVVFDPDATFVVDPAALHQRQTLTPYAGRELRGVVRHTLVRGVHVDGVRARGRLLSRFDPEEMPCASS